jgi:hypothetical protein
MHKIYFGLINSKGILVEIWANVNEIKEKAAATRVGRLVGGFRRVSW